jgi:hypothetical protein
MKDEANKLFEAARRRIDAERRFTEQSPREGEERIALAKVMVHAREADREAADAFEKKMEEAGEL